MSGFNVAELMPFYLDETDEHIAALNDALLRLEQDPGDAKALQEAFRFFHSIKGSSVIMGFGPVNKLTHHLESLYDQLRSKKRTLDRVTLDLTFRCLDELRDYHRDLRARGQSEVDLSGSIARVVEHLGQPQGAPPVVPATTFKTGAEPWLEEGAAVAIVVVFQANLPLADMKARLVLNRLSSKARILATSPPVEQLEEIETLKSFRLVVTTDADEAELRSLADVEGVDEIRIEPAGAPVEKSDGARAVPEATTEEAPEPAPGLPLHDPGELSPAARVEAAAGAAAARAIVPEAPVQASAQPEGPRPGAKKSKIAETIRVDSDRLDHLMNLAGELVITKARFIAISAGLERLFKSSNAQTLTSDTRERLESISRGLESLSELRSTSSGTGVERWSAHLRRLRDNFRTIQEELDVIRVAREQLKALSEAIHSLGRVSDGLQKGVLDTRMVPIGPLFERFRRVIRDLSHSSGQGSRARDRRREDRARQADDRRAVRPADPHGAQRGRPRTGDARGARGSGQAAAGDRLAAGIASRQQRGDHGERRRPRHRLRADPQEGGFEGAHERAGGARRFPSAI